MTDTKQHSPPGITAVILDSVADGVFTVDEQFLITSFNRAAEQITGVSRKEAIGRPCCEVLRADICEAGCALKDAMNSGQPVIDRTVHILRTNGELAPVSIRCAVLRDDRQKMIGGVETFRDLSLVEELRRRIHQQHTLGDIVSRNHRMQQLFAVLPQIASTDSTVLIEGESGTGKEVLARSIHDLSPRREKPLITVNCAALPDTLLESELFGYVAGAFTDAKRDKPGRFALADGGTIFFDEIGDISPALQVRLLRVIQERTFEPLGSTRTLKVDVRVISATNRDLKKEVEEGRFREDLFYRINVVRLALPPLRERKEDILLLAEQFINRMNRLQGKNISGLSDESTAAMMRYNWPGNIRELENAIEHAFVLCRSEWIELRHLPETLRGMKPGGTPRYKSATLREIERQAIYEALIRNKWRRLATARELGINKTTLWRKIRQYSLEPPDSGQSDSTRKDNKGRHKGLRLRHIEDS
ncbi:MAG TPA: sigma 54-interacting transcriptional regulator [bacterium]|nr:sigma 54-interacting transcriptional regulator [bacterium]HQL60685.1 sigma 54-interacting transcriptional regulator [bacterium]